MLNRNFLTVLVPSMHAKIVQLQKQLLDESKRTEKHANRGENFVIELEAIGHGKSDIGCKPELISELLLVYNVVSEESMCMECNLLQCHV